MLQLHLATFPILSTKQLVLRELRMSDSPQVFNLRSDPVVMRHVNRPLATTLDDARALVERVTMSVGSNEAVQWAITRKGEDTFIGLIGFWRFVKEHHFAELGYTLAQQHWGQGYMSEAIDAAVQCGFSTLGLHRIEAITRPANRASVRVLEKNGFAQEGHLREDIYWNGTYHDSLHFGRLAH